MEKDNSWRPPNWPKCPCDGCERKVMDGYGLLCDLSCGEYTAWLNREAGADAMYAALEEELKKVYIGLRVLGDGRLIFIEDNEDKA